MNVFVKTQVKSRPEQDLNRYQEDKEEIQSEDNKQRTKQDRESQY